MVPDELFRAILWYSVGEGMTHACGIDRHYWAEAGMRGRFKQINDPACAKEAMLAYWRAKCPKALAEMDYETLVRVHFGGPAGRYRKSTRRYWTQIKKIMEERSDN